MHTPCITLRRAFVADHFHALPAFREARHGHNWELEATVVLEDEGTEAALAEALDAWVRTADYGLLNAQPPLEARNPTAEAVAQWALEALEARGFRVEQVRVREKTNYWAACRREAP